MCAATYHHLWKNLSREHLSDIHSIAVSWTPSWGILLPLYAIRCTDDETKPMGNSVLGKELGKVCRVMIVQPEPVLTLQCRFPWPLRPILADTLIVRKAFVIPSMLKLVIVVTQDLSGCLWWCVAARDHVRRQCILSQVVMGHHSYTVTLSQCKSYSSSTFMTSVSLEPSQPRFHQHWPPICFFAWQAAL